MSEAIEMMRAFEYVRDVYRTTATMLLAADALLDGWIPYDWDAIWPKRGTGLKSAEEWAPAFVIRQYHRWDRNAREVLTLGAALYGTKRRPLIEAMCLGSWMGLRTGEPNEIYDWALVQRWTGLPADGQVRAISSPEIPFVPEERAKFDSEVIDGRVVSVAVPLPSVKTTADLGAAILVPLLAHPSLG